MTEQSLSKIMIVALLVFAALTACSPVSNEGAAPEETPTAEPGENPLADTKWDLVSLDDVLVDGTLTVDFSADTVSGTDGCNSFGGSYTVQDSTIVMADSFAVTEMFCPDENVMETASQYLNALVTADRFTLDGSTLTIETKAETLVFTETVAAELNNNRWQLAGLNNNSGGIVLMAIDEAIFIEFNDDGTISGNGGCNSFSGEVTVDGNTITFGNIAVTLMSCADEDVMERETEFLTALDNVATYTIVRQSLSLYSDDGTLVAQFNMADTSETKTLYISAEQVDCIGEAPQKCLLVKDDPNGEYLYFYDDIEGFEYELGFEYVLLVQVSEIENPPADGSSLRYELVEIMSQTAVEDNGSVDLQGNTWYLSHLIVGGDALVPAPAGVEVTLEMNDDVASGQAGCNSYSGTIEIAGNNIVFGPLAVTTRACSEEIDNFEQGVLEMFAMVGQYVIKENGVLVLKTADGLDVAEFTTSDATTDSGIPTMDNLTLVGITWQWIAFTNTARINNIEVGDPSQYTIKFLEDGTYALQNDCNVGNGSFTQDGSSLTIEPGITTMAACSEESLDKEFGRLMGDVVTYVIEDGQLLLNLKLDAGNMVFEPMP